MYNTTLGLLDKLSSKRKMSLSSYTIYFYYGIEGHYHATCYKLRYSEIAGLVPGVCTSTRKTAISIFIYMLHGCVD